MSDSESVSTTSRRLRDEATASTTRKPANPNNQETHDKRDSADAATTGASKSSSRVTSGGAKSAAKKPKKKAPQLSALEEVQRRKKMFAKWIKTAGTTSSDTTDPANASPASSAQDALSAVATSSTSLPPIHQQQRALALHGPETNILDEPEREAFHLPLLRQSLVASESLPAAVTTSASSAPGDWDFLQPYEPSTRALGDGASEPPDLDDSLDEDEVNNLLNWTDTLLSPTAMDASFPHVDDDGDLDTQ